ncbi:MAG: hypothetical protein LBV29_06625, partial [Azoarcus sp.]|nr:hypothetical protein [Azoarcus sp.]
QTSQTEGEERLAEKVEAIEYCMRECESNTTIGQLADECAKYEGQAVTQQQLVADCQVAAYNYANALRMLKSE